MKTNNNRNGEHSQEINSSKSDYIQKILHDSRLLTVDEKKQIVAAIYARVSSNSQVFGYSQDEQVRLCEERCKMLNWKVRYIFKENGKSGGTLDRPKFQLMMEKARENRFNVIIFWKLDRFCRSLVDLVNVERTLRKNGVGLHSVTEQIDTITAFGKFNFRNIASASELERDLIMERVKMGMKARALKHKWLNKNPPFGYKINKDGFLKINDNQADLVLKIFKMYVKLKSMPQVAYELNKVGITTEKGKKWNATSINRILDNEIYIGVYKVMDVEDSVKEYKIIDKKLFEKVMQLQELSKKERRKMPDERKLGTIEKVFNEYLEYLDECEENIEAKIM